MSQDQAKTVSLVYRRLISIEEKEYKKWSDIDESLSLLEYLDDKQTYREADSIYYKIKDKNPRCKMDHKASECFMPIFMEAVSAILKLYEKTESLHPKNKYILQNFIAMYDGDEIIFDIY